MRYIFMAAGKGTRLHPLTFSYPKAMYKLDSETTVLGHMVDLIKKYDSLAEIIVVTGYKHKVIEQNLKDIKYIVNPFYETTNSIASLWFAREYLNGEQTVILNADIVISEKLVKDKLCQPTDRPLVFVDGSNKQDGDYNVEVSGDKVLVMSKELKNYYGEYTGIVKIDPASVSLVCKELETMIDEGFYDQWFENVFVQMIFKYNFYLYFEDVSDYKWTELDSVNDLLYAKEIYLQNL